MLSVIGLALDLVGAMALVFGLFTHADPHWLGWRRSPDEYAHDAAFGVVGAAFLVFGFAFQSLTYLGVHVTASHRAIAAAGVAALALATLGAWLAYGTLFLLFFGAERRRTTRLWSDRYEPRWSSYPTRRERQGLRFWAQRRINDSEEDSTHSAQPQGEA